MAGVRVGPWIQPDTSRHDLEDRAYQERLRLEREQARARAAEAQEEIRMRAILEPSFIREVEGRTNTLLAAGWCQFQGKVVDITAQGVRVDGSFHSLVGATNQHSGDFFVAHFPYQVVDGSYLAEKDYYAAKEVGTYTYATVAGSSRTIHKLDYGRVVSLPPAPLDQVAAAQAQAAKAVSDRKAEQAASVLKHFQTEAECGDAYAQRRLGELYRDGLGTGKDPAKARLWFGRAAAQGDKDAAAALAQCPAGK